MHVLLRPAALALALTLFAAGSCLAAANQSTPKEATMNDGLYAKITTDKGDILLQLFYDKTPMTVINFAGLATGQIGPKKGAPYYDGLTFHRVIAGYWIQGGDPLGDNTGGPGYRIKGEFAENGFRQNRIGFTRGVVAMARKVSDYNSAGSQFFIMHSDYPDLYGKYAAFGRVMDEESMETVDKIAATQVDTADKPLTEWRIKSVTVDDKGHEYIPMIVQEKEEEEENE